jgi:hypothetical protein
MIVDTITLLSERDEIHDYVASLWSDGPIARSHREAGLVHRIVDRFAQLPRLFYDASDLTIEWTHFSTWWGAILRGDYDNPVIRDLRYLHEIYHAATIPYVANLSTAAMAVRNFQNEREASTFTEIAIYLELPDLRPLSFPHPIFADRIVFPGGDLSRPDPVLVERWQTERDRLFKELMYQRLQPIMADPSEIDIGDPQIVWLRRYAEQADAWVEVWKDHHRLVDEAMLRLRANCAAEGRKSAAQRHLDWLLSAEIGDGAIPFVEQARNFRVVHDRLLALYDAAMTSRNQKAIAHSGEKGLNSANS